MLLFSLSFLNLFPLPILLSLRSCLTSHLSISLISHFSPPFFLSIGYPFSFLDTKRLSPNLSSLTTNNHIFSFTLFLPPLLLIGSSSYSLPRFSSSSFLHLRSILSFFPFSSFLPIPLPINIKRKLQDSVALKEIVISPNDHQKSLRNYEYFPGGTFVLSNISDHLHQGEKTKEDITQSMGSNWWHELEKYGRK